MFKPGWIRPFCIALLCLAKAPHAAERDSLVFTHYTERSELFLEFRMLAVGEESPFAVHLTDLTDFSPISQGQVTAVLSGGGEPEESFVAGPSGSPGIFRPIVKPLHAGDRVLTVTLASGASTVRHELGTIRVHPDLEHAPSAGDAAKVPGEISFLKEQQWQVDFRVAPLVLRRLRSSLPATGTLKAPSDSETTISAPSSGILVFDATAPLVGHSVERGQRLASIVPRLAERGDITALEEESHMAQLRHEQAHREEDRLAQLLDSGVVAQRQVLGARTTHQLTHAELEAAQKRLNQYSRPANAAAGGIPIASPIQGNISRSFVSNGRYVTDGEPLFHIVHRGRLWLEVRVPEADASRLAQLTGAAFQLDGFEPAFEITPGRNGRLISFSTVVDPANRTLPVVFELDHPDPRLPLGGFARVRLFNGQSLDALAVPESAIVDDNGVSVVFVQTGGESFERRPVTLGLRDGEYLEVIAGLSSAERVVTRGAYLVYLASTAPGAAVHGHVH